jgi:hypothetical protein
MVDIGSRERRKGMSLVLLLVAAVWATPTCLAQQVTPYPPGVYGMWPTVVPNSAGVPNDISSGVRCSGTPEQCTVPTTCMPATTHPPYTGQLLLENRPEPLGTGGVVGILLNVLWTDVDTGISGPMLNWNAMDQLLIEAQLCGLSVALSLDMPLTSLPPWVAGQLSPSGPIQTVNLDIGTVPVFWNTTFNKYRANFIQAAATHIYSSGLLSPDVQQNIVAVVAQPFGAMTDDWDIPSTDSDVTAWKTAGYTTNIMLGAAQTILNAAAENFPTLNLKLPIQVDLDIPPTGTDVGLATQVLDWAYGAFPGRFFAQLNFVRANTNPSAPNCATSTTPCPASPPDCVSPCQLDAVNRQTDMPVNPQSPYSVFNLIRQYQPQGVGLQDVAAAVDGGAPGNNCQQNGTIPCTPPICNDSTDPTQYATVSQNTWYVVQTYTPTFWEISRGDATMAFGTANPCYPMYPTGLPSDQQAAMRAVFAAVTTQLERSATCAQNVGSDFYITRSGYVFNPGTKLFYQTVKLTNTGSAEIGGPIELVLDNLSSNASLSNQSGVTTCAAPLPGNPYLGSPYIVATKATLLPEASVSVVLEFSDPTKATTTYTPRMLAGAGTP